MHARWIISAALLLLQGCVPLLIGGAATGVGAAHDRRTLGAIIDDENIELKAAAAIGLDANINKLVHVNITSMNGIVLLTGEAATAEARDRVLTHLRAVNGVRRITNESTPRPASSAAAARIRSSPAPSSRASSSPGISTRPASRSSPRQTSFT